VVESNCENVTKLVEKIKSEWKWGLGGDANGMSEHMEDCIQKSAKEFLGVSKVGSGRMRGAWWWCKEVKEKVKAK